jgi:hypothetical protein
MFASLRHRYRFVDRPGSATRTAPSLDCGVLVAPGYHFARWVYMRRVLLYQESH